MILRPPRSTRTDTLLPYTTLFRSCLDLLVSLGIRRENIWVTDIVGVVYEGRTELMDRWKARYAQPTDKRKLAEVIEGADVFLGLPAPGVLKPAMGKAMGERPIIRSEERRVGKGCVRTCRSRWLA